MKLNKIESINIGGLDYIVVWDKKYSGGSFSPSKHTIRIGLGLGETYAFGILIHELKEIIQQEQSCRFERSDEDNNFYFFYSHKEHTDLCARLSEYLLKFIK